MKKQGLLNEVRKKVRVLLNNYVNHELITKEMHNYIVAPELRDLAGALGAIALAEEHV